MSDASRPHPLASFHPNAERARRLDARMRERLAESIRHVIERAGSRVAVPPALDGFFARLARGPVRPDVFALYGDLVLAVENGRLEESARCLAEMADSAPPEPGIRILPLGDRSIDGASERRQRFVDTDPGAPFEILPPPPERARAAHEQVASALRWIAAADPDLSAELHALVREIVLAVGPARRGARTFDGASSLLLWGAILINAASPRTRLETAQVLAHESAHGLLFGIAADDPLVLDPDHQLFPSPLRGDPRPLEGTFHATFVLARMHRATQRLARAGLEGSERAEAARALARQEAAFARGMETLDRHAQLTPLGVDVIEPARSYMNECRARSSSIARKSANR